ncbi:MAG: response regulator transcription factor [Phycisphaerae bacterium]|nr:response regulator transcription factor [Phycisphaerae bacterium]
MDFRPAGIPLAHDTPELESTLVSEPGTKPLDGKKILLVDDDPDIIATIQASLSGSGADIRTASDGNRASDLVVSFQPDLMILDMMLPKRSGFLILERMRPKKEKGQKPFVIMITANEGRRHEAYARNLGVDEYLLKPLRMDKLLSTAYGLLGVEYNVQEY